MRRKALNQAPPRAATEQGKVFEVEITKRAFGAPRIALAALIVAIGVVVASPSAAGANPAAATASPITVGTSAELVAALKAVQPGQTISLKDGTYKGAFVAKVWGTASARITLTGSRNAILTSGSLTSGYGLQVTGSYWDLKGFSVTNSSKGIMLDGSTFTVIDGVDVGNIGDEGVHFRKNSSDSTIRNSAVHDTGKARAEYGEGIYIGSANSNWISPTVPDTSDRVQVLNNTISNTTGEGIDVKEGTAGGIISGNVFANSGYSGANYADSWIDVKGNGYQVTGNSGSGTLLDAFQVHVQIDGWGRDSVFQGNTVSGGVPGYEVWVESANIGTLVGCKATSASKGLANVACTG
jgi:hypothetical protein